MRSAALTKGTIAAAQAAARSVRRGAARARPPFSGRTGAGLLPRTAAGAGTAIAAKVIATALREP